jgi:hypothetical protein
MELFPSIKRSLESQKLSGENEVKYIQPTFNIVEYQLSTIVDKINNIDNLDDNEIKNIIIRQISMILDYDLFLSSSESRYYAQSLFSNKRFLKIFLEVIGFLTLTKDQCICINKLAYDYYILPEKDKEVSDLLLQISYRINNILVIRLSSKLDMNGARVLSMIANSSFKDEKNVHRINTFLVKYNFDLSVQDIIDIYCIIFQSFTHPFIYSMLETKPNNMSPEQLKKFDNISLALLAILDSMTSADIKKVLYDYGFVLKLMKPGFVVRFSLKSAKAYPRILQVIEDIENDFDSIEEIKIP